MPAFGDPEAAVRFVQEQFQQWTVARPDATLGPRPSSSDASRCADPGTECDAMNVSDVLFNVGFLSPLLAAGVAGLVLASTNRSRSPRIARLITIASILMLVTIAG